MRERGKHRTAGVTESGPRKTTAVDPGSLAYTTFTNNVCSVIGCLVQPHFKISAYLNHVHGGFGVASVL